MIARTPKKAMTAEEKKVDDAIKLENQRQITAFRNVFTTPEGKDAWAFLHLQLGTWGSDPNPEPWQAAWKAFGMKLYEYAGINYEVNHHELTNAHWKVRPVFETEKLLESEEKKE